MRSMTAFAQASGSSKEGAWEIEIRSLNHRYFEFSLKVPASLGALENRIRDFVQSGMRRGKITVSVSQKIKNGNEDFPAIDEKAVKHYLKTFQSLKKKFKLSGELTLSDLLKLPGLFGGQEAELNAEKIWPELKKILQKAVERATQAKLLEGGKLAKDIQSRLQAVTKALQSIEKHTAGQAEKILKRISERIQALVEEKNLDKERLEREAAFLAERTDITEEIVRMKSHLDLFQKRLKQEAEVGRELDFLCQEMNREVNTMASKSQHFDISTEVVFVKGELEKIREQIQNIE